MRKLMLVTIVVAAAAGLAESPVFAADGFARSTWQPCAGEPARASPWIVAWPPALTSMGIATVSYLMTLFGRH